MQSALFVGRQAKAHACVLLRCGDLIETGPNRSSGNDRAEAHLQRIFLRTTLAIPIRTGAAILQLCL